MNASLGFTEKVHNKNQCKRLPKKLLLWSYKSFILLCFIPVPFKVIMVMLVSFHCCDWYLTRTTYRKGFFWPSFRGLSPWSVEADTSCQKDMAEEKRRQEGARKIESLRSHSQWSIFSSHAPPPVVHFKWLIHKMKSSLPWVNHFPLNTVVLPNAWGFGEQFRSKP